MFQKFGQLLFLSVSMCFFINPSLIGASDYPVPEGYYQGPCGELYTDKYIENLINYDSSKSTLVKHLVPLRHLNLRLEFWPQSYGFYLVKTSPSKYERFMFWKCNCHGQDMGFSFSKLNPADDASVGLFLLSEHSSEWSWSKNLTPERRFIRKERLERNQVYAKEFSFGLKDGRDVVRAEQAAQEIIIEKEKAWSFNFKLIPIDLREGFFCLKPTIEGIKSDLFELKK